METTLDDVIALLGLKEVQLYIANKRIAELEAQLESTNDTEDTDKE